MIEITPSLKIDESEIQWIFVRGSGPGGQNVNKVATVAQLRFDIPNSPSLPPQVKERLIKIAGKRLSDEGILIIEAKRYRTQEQNRLDALRRFTVLLQKASEIPRVRKATRPSQRAKALRLLEKKKRAEIKRQRRYQVTDSE